MDDNLEYLKISALSKSKCINPYVKNTTIGINRLIIEETDDNSKAHKNQPPRKKDKKRTENVVKSPVVFQKMHKNIEEQRQKQLQQTIELRRHKFIIHHEQSHINQTKDLEIKQKMLIREKNQQELLILQTSEQHDVSIKNQELSHYYEEMAERKRKIDKELKEYEKRKQILFSLIDEIKSHQVEFNRIYQDVFNNFQNCRYPNELKLIIGDIPHKLNSLANEMGETVNKCKTGNVRKNEINKSAQLVKDVQDILNSLKQKILKVTIEQDSKKEQEQAKPKVLIKGSEPALLNLEVDTYISKNSLQIYADLQNFLETFTNSYSDLTNNESFKQFKFDCKKGINTPVNAISAVNSQHLLDKYNRLSNLLTGKIVEVGGTHICASKHPKGIAFSLNLLAKKFVLQSDLMISSNPEAAYSYAAIIVALWNDNPDFGKLLLAHMYKQCPYLVPFYPVQSAGQTDQDYYLSLGYQYNENVVEKQDKFLKRMTGIIRLYSAIIISKPKRGQKENPYGISEGWRWLSSFLNLPPKPDITATMLHVFLENVGSTMQAVYKKMFNKLINFIYQHYLPMIQKIDSGGPVTRLEGLLQGFKRVGKFQAPVGILPNNFW
ncbi:hypothetical protein FQR65_LT07195 [Abscondita terminalis]|nr:hypothetical protein FQR65_LT07195 [Abscondita terminalis]